MSQYWSPIVKTLTPYIPGEQPKIHNLVKLNTNENPYGPSPMAVAAMQGEIGENLKLYPDPNGQKLKAAIADYYQLNQNQVFVGNGSDEVLAHAFCGLLSTDKPLLFPDITYSFYPVYAGLYQISYQQLPLTNQFEIDVEDYIAHKEAGAIIFPNPNAPTGRLLPLSAIERLLKMRQDKVVVVDEAYIDFGGQSAVGLIDQYPNLLVIQTLSKSRALAGIRVGFAMGHSDLIEALERVKNSFNSYPLGRADIAAAVAAFEDDAYFRQSCDKIIGSRDWLTAQLSRLNFNAIPSAANFVFASHQSQSAESLAARLREKGIIVRHFSQPRIDNHLRITVGTPAQCQQLVEALEDILTAS